MGHSHLGTERIINLNQDDEYSSFMVRFRRMHKDNPSTWVIFVQAIQTGQVVCFSRLDGLIEFLQARFGDSIKLEAANPHLESGSKGSELEPESGKQPPEADVVFRPQI